MLQPQFSQELLGYTATVAGEALTGGGLVLLILAPLSGIASDKDVYKRQARYVACDRCDVSLDEG